MYEANCHQTTCHICKMKEVPHVMELTVLEERDEAKRCSWKPNYVHVKF